MGGCLPLGGPAHDRRGGTCIHKEEGQYPGFSCLHEHCRGRTLLDVLAMFSPGDVERHCSDLYGGRALDNIDVEEILVSPRPTGPEPQIKPNRPDPRTPRQAAF
jgi:hypothetical protein